MFITRCPWYIAGPLLGLLIVSLRAAVNKPLGVLGGYIDIAQHAWFPRRLGFGAFLLLGVVLGGALFTFVAGSVGVTTVYSNRSGILPPEPATQLVILLLAGVAMGFGATSAGGCTSGHGLNGMAACSPASVVATLTFFATAVLLAHAFAWLF